MGSAKFASIHEAERLAKRRMPKSVYAAFSAGADQSRTLRDNVGVFAEVGFRPRAAIRFEERELATTVLGHPCAFPVLVSPVGGLRLAHRDGELGAVRAAGAMGVPIGISTMSSRAIEDIVAATTAPVLYQLYLSGGRDAAEAGIARARAAGCVALAVTVDLLGHGSRRPGKGARDQIPTRITVRNALRYFPELAVRPRWFAGFAREGLRLTLPNVRPSADAPPLLFAEAAPICATWDDFGWIREAWSGPLVVKGIIRGDDAKRAVQVGAHAVVVSNHGGFGLDGTPATLRALPEVVRAIGDDVEILLDGGIRRGGDVVKALAMGARAVLCGRANVWGLGAAGGAGVQRVLEILRDEIDRTLAELGCGSVHDLHLDDLDLPLGWPARRPVI